MATAPLNVVRTPRDSHWKCHWSPVSPLAATKTREVSTRGGTQPRAQLRNGLGVISAALHSKIRPFRDRASVQGAGGDGQVSGEKQHCFSAGWLSQHGDS